LDEDELKAWAADVIGSNYKEFTKRRRRKKKHKSMTERVKVKDNDSLKMF